jgi:iron complex outermembrane receptor protein
MKRKNLWIDACTVGIAVSLAAGASAQEMPSDAGKIPGKTTAPLPAPTISEGIQEVVVTAQRRSESIQKSSLAITAISADQLQQAGVLQARDLTKLVPGVQIGQGGPATQIYIRGVGDFTSTPVTNPAVAVNVDGVYVARAQAVEGNFFDLERIEVIKGPQGTLYGRNASAGAVNIISRKPVLGDTSGDLHIEIGNYGLVKTELAGNLALSDVVALRAAVQAVRRNGYATQGLDDDHHRSVRLQALIKPSDTFSVRLSADYSHIGGLGPAYVFKAVDPTLAAAIAAKGVALPTDVRANGSDPSIEQMYFAIGAALGRCIPNSALAAAATAAGPAPITNAPQGLCPAGQSSLVSAPGNSVIGDSAHVDNTFKNLSAEVNWDLGFATLTFIPAYRKVENNYVTYPLVTYNSSAGRPELSVSKSVEVRLGNTSEALKWVAGVFRFKEDQSATTSSNGGLIIGRSINQYSILSDSTAAFGQLTYSLSPTTRMIAGLRYTSDDKLIDGVNLTGGPGLPFVPGQTCYLKSDPCLRDTFKGEKTFKNTSYKAGIEHDITAKNMVYFTVATGYKSGGGNPLSVSGTANVASFYDPEKLTAFELGSRNRFLGDRLRVNMEGFYWKYKDAQQFYSTVNAAGTAVSALTNAGAATIFGADVDLTYKLTPYDTFRIGAEYLHSTFDKFTYTAAGAIPDVTTGCRVTPGSPFATIDCGGKPLPRAPRYSGTASASHRFELANGARLEATVAGQFAAKRYLTVDYTKAAEADSYVSGDMILNFSPANGDWSVSAFVRNFTDTKIYTGAFSIPSLFRSYTVGNIAAPRTFGVSLSAHF